MLMFRELGLACFRYKDICSQVVQLNWKRSNVRMLEDLTIVGVFRLGNVREKMRKLSKRLLLKKYFIFILIRGLDMHSQMNLAWIALIL